MPISFISPAPKGTRVPMSAFVFSRLLTTPRSITQGGNSVTHSLIQHGFCSLYPLRRCRPCHTGPPCEIVNRRGRQLLDRCDACLNQPLLAGLADAVDAR